jgi:hypothetical protein
MFIRQDNPQWRMEYSGRKHAYDRHHPFEPDASIPEASASRKVVILSRVSAAKDLCIPADGAMIECESSQT